jgi:hypothetical protein
LPSSLSVECQKPVVSCRWVPCTQGLAGSLPVISPRRVDHTALRDHPHWWPAETTQAFFGSRPLDLFCRRRLHSQPPSSSVIFALPAAVSDLDLHMTVASTTVEQNRECPEHGVKRLHTARLAWLYPPEGGPAKAVRLHRWCAGLVSDNGLVLLWAWQGGRSLSLCCSDCLLSSRLLVLPARPRDEQV